MVIRIESLDDPRLDVYRNLKEKELDRAGRLFIAEGEYIVRRLFESDFPVESVFVAERYLESFERLVGAELPLFVTPHALMRSVLGMKFHSGVMACGRRKPWRRLEEVAPLGRDRLTLVVCPETHNVQNVGSIVRIAAALGADAMLLGERCHDPFWRQSIRVSMGSVFRLPLYQATDLLADLELLRERWGVELAATVLDPAAEPLEGARRAMRFAILFGNEAQGLSPEYEQACARRITIPMHLGTDSLNVSVAAGIFLYHFTRLASFR
jgi:tRNA G18 (ribose-2'-O)-methylase SpoU